MNRWNRALQKTIGLSTITRILEISPQKRKNGQIKQLSQWFMKEQRSLVEKICQNDQELLVRLCRAMKYVRVLPGQVIIRQGDIGRECFIVLSGMCHVYYNSSGRPVDDYYGKNVGTRTAGMIFGEVALQDDGINRTRTATVRAAAAVSLFESVQLIVLDRDSFQQIKNNLRHGQMSLYDKRAVLQSSYLFKDLSFNDINQLAIVAKEHKFLPDQILYSATEPLKVVYFLLSGEVKLIETIKKSHKQHRDVQVLLLGPLSIVNLETVVVHHRRSRQQRAHGTTRGTYWSIPLSTFDDLFSEGITSVKAVNLQVMQRMKQLYRQREAWFDVRTSMSLINSDIFVVITRAMQVDAVPCSRCGLFGHYSLNLLSCQPEYKLRLGVVEKKRSKSKAQIIVATAPTKRKDSLYDIREKMNEIMLTKRDTFISQRTVSAGWNVQLNRFPFPEEAYDDTRPKTPVKVRQAVLAKHENRLNKALRGLRPRRKHRKRSTGTSRRKKK